MTATTGRFTAYLPREREILARRAQEEGCSENYLVRMGVRAVLGLSVPARLRDEIRAALDAGDPAGRRAA